MVATTLPVPASSSSPFDFSDTIIRPTGYPTVALPPTGNPSNWLSDRLASRPIGYPSLYARVLVMHAMHACHVMQVMCRWLAAMHVMHACHAYTSCKHAMHVMRVVRVMHWHACHHSRRASHRLPTGYPADWVSDRLAIRPTDYPTDWLSD